MAYAIVHETNSQTGSAATSGNVTIPATTAGNLVIVGFNPGSGQAGPVVSAITTNTGDTPIQVPLYSRSNAGLGGGASLAAGNMYQFKGSGAGIQMDLWYFISAGGTTNIHWVISYLAVNGIFPYFWIWEISGITNWTLLDYQGSGSISASTFSGPTLSVGANSAIFFAIGIAQSNINSDGSLTVSSPWVLDTHQNSSGKASAVYLLNASGSQTPNLNSSDSPDVYLIGGAAFGPPTGGGGTPVINVGTGTGGGGILGTCTAPNLTIAPATELYQLYVPPAQIALSQYPTEGRIACVLDFNSGDGLYSRDIETEFDWSIQSRFVLRVWQPSIIPMPENIYNRPSDWIDGGNNDNKFIQGITIEADSFNQPKVFQLQSGDDLSLHALNEMPATFIKQTIKTFSCVTPFIAHNVRLFSTDGVPWRVWGTSMAGGGNGPELLSKPWPSQATNWQTEMTSFGMTGWLHDREMNVAYASATPLTVVLTPDVGPPVTITLPASGGATTQVKTKVTLPPMKFKMLSVQVTSTGPFYLFDSDMELKIKSWGSVGPYNVIKVVGGPTQPGAVV